MIYGWFYRTLMKLAHRFNWHHTRTCYPDGDTLLVCDWCGLRYVKHRRGGFMGMKITVDETMPPGTMEMRSGKHVVRVVNLWRLFRRTAGRGETMKNASLAGWPKTATLFRGRLIIGLFNYWIGFSNRDIGSYRVIDCGMVKFMWING